MKKGISGALVGIFAIVIAVIFFGGILSMSQVQQPEEVEMDYGGDFEAFQPLQEVTGYNDLDVSEESLSDSNTAVDDGNVVTKFNVNDSDGDTLRFAFGVAIGGPMESIDFEMVNEGVADNFDVKSVKLIEDEDDDLSIDEARAVREFSVDSDGEIDEETGSIQDGDYAVVLEVRGTDTSGITTDQDLYTFNLNADTDADSDEAEEMSVTIDNAA